MSFQLPEPIADYLATEDSSDTDVLARCFAEDAVVHDEGRSIEVVSAIKAWKREAQAKYQYSVQVLAVSEDGDSVNVPVRLTGNFPGSPLDVEYRFNNGKIASLEIK
jgi:hypothetical protein